VNAVAKDKNKTVSSKHKDKCIPPVCFCETGEVLVNGNFEIPGVAPFDPFAGWEVHARTLDIELVRDTQNVFESSVAASVRTGEPLVPTSILILRQYVDVTPGCLYQLQFAERLVSFTGDDTVLPLLVASVIYMDRSLNEYDLLSIPILKSEEDPEFNVHQHVAEIAVPCEVPAIIVQFSFYITNAPGTVWNLDAVSLQAVSATSACCCI
jgi:hypothetical protein